jgi:hypothetical protein
MYNSKTKKLVMHTWLSDAIMQAYFLITYLPTWRLIPQYFYLQSFRYAYKQAKCILIILKLRYTDSQEVEECCKMKILSN